MINAVIIDDEPLAIKVIAVLCSQSGMVNVLNTFTKPTEALKYLRKYPVDLVFCDIQMPSMTGIDLVKNIPQNSMVIFTTAYSEYAVVSYELNAIDYLLKPINQKRFTQAILKAHDYYNHIHGFGTENPQYIYVRADYSLVKINMNDILYIEGMSDYLKIYIQDRKTVIARMTMKAVLEKLNSTNFIRIHRSFIIPINNIESVRGSSVFMYGKEFPIGRTYIDNFQRRYASYDTGL